MKTVQKMIKSIISVSILLVAAIAISCDDDTPDNLASIEVKIALPKNSSLSKEGIKTTITNIENNTKLIVLTNSKGIAKFNAIPEGNYNISVDEKKEGMIITGSLASIRVNRNTTVNKELLLKIGLEKGNLIIKQLYYSGSNEPTFSVMFKDQFIEIHNNSSKELYADGLYIANLHGSSRFDKGRPSHIVSKQFDISKKVYADWIVQIPGNGKKYPIAPGKSIIIAFNAINFKEISNSSSEKHTVLDLSKANFETFAKTWLEGKGRTGSLFDENNPDVPNVKPIFLVSALDAFLWDMSGTTAIIFKADKAPSKKDIVTFLVKDNDKTREAKLAGIPIEQIIDAVEFLGNAKAKDYKRLPATIDNGFFYLFAEGDGSLTGKGMLRKVDQESSKKAGYTIYKDTNNSTLDFVVTKPQI